MHAAEKQRPDLTAHMLVLSITIIHRRLLLFFFSVVMSVK